jgi:peptidoglycan/xylan/chitin deacetylase (PgdA/CDA1 family)
MYHRVSQIEVDPWGLAVHPARFEEHIDVLTRTRRVVPLTRLIEEEQRRSSRDKALAVVTFDDGYHDVYSNARQTLLRYSCPMTLFVATGSLGSNREFWWDAICRIFLETKMLPPSLTLELPEKTFQWSVPPFENWDQRQKLFYEVWAQLRVLAFPQQLFQIEKLGSWAGCDLVARETHRIMTKDEVRSISDGLITVGAHTVSHPTLPAHDLDLQYREIVDSRRACEELLGNPITAFAYPYGDYNDVTISAVRHAGFSQACTAENSVVLPGTNLLTLPRLYIADWKGDEFQQRISVQ